MILKVHFFAIILFLLLISRYAIAQSQTNSQNGNITVRVACNCQIISEKSNQPLHFAASDKIQHDTRHLKIISNCAWDLSVISNIREYEYNNDKKDKWEKDNSQITYTINNIKGTGSLSNANIKYVLGSSARNFPSGIGELEFDVIFELEGDELKLSKLREDNTWVSFYVLPKE